MPNSTALRLNHLSYRYGGIDEVLCGLSLEIGWGEKCAIIGPNGAGKSTLLACLAGIFETDGDVLVGDIPVRPKYLEQIRQIVGIVFQDPDDQLFCPTVYDDIAFGPRNFGLPEAEVQVRVGEALRIVGMAGYERKIAYHLSFGEKQRIALATVLAMQPKILLLDEPTSSLDPRRRRRLIEWLTAWSGTLLIASHDLDMVLDVCARTILINHGRVVADGPSRDILANESLLQANDLELPICLVPAKPGQPTAGSFRESP
jgi:cobalt/nickel transport system ATP-binding protein